jgi:Family of unknown function (DUF6533)
LEYILQFASIGAPESSYSRAIRLIVAIAVLYYDYMLTLKDEITYIWMRKWKLSTLFYFCCRYALLANLLYLLAISEDLTGLKVRQFPHIFPTQSNAWFSASFLHSSSSFPYPRAAVIQATRSVACSASWGISVSWVSSIPSDYIPTTHASQPSGHSVHAPSTTTTNGSLASLASWALASRSCLS